VNYTIKTDHLSDKYFNLNVFRQDGITKTIVFTKVITPYNYEEAYYDLFALIRKINKLFNETAILTLPSNWSFKEYLDLLDTFNADQCHYYQLEDNIDGITIVAHPSLA